MFYLQNFKHNTKKFACMCNNVNSFKILKLSKYDIYPCSKRDTMKSIPTNLIINSGKLIINMKKYNNELKMFNQKTLFGENNKLFDTDIYYDNLLANDKYILTIQPGVLYSFKSYEENTIIQIFYKYGDYMDYYKYEKDDNYINFAQ